MATQVEAAPPLPILNHKFTVMVGTIKIGCTKISGIKAEMETVPYREGWEEGRKRMQKGLVTNNAVTIETGVTENRKELRDWWIASQNDDPDSRREVLININGRSGAVVQTVKLRRAFPKEHGLGDLDALESNVLLQNVVIEHEGMEFA